MNATMKNFTDRQKDRVEWIDFAKGITIILVIIGHTVDGILKGAIFSFHMPLFFILSCITFKCSINAEKFLSKTERAFKHLVIPAIVMYLIATYILCINNISLFVSTDYIRRFIKERILAAVYSSGVPFSILGVEIQAISIPWFLIALFLGRTLFDYLNLRFGEKKAYVISCVLSVMGIFFGKFQWLPLSFDIVLVILPFFIIGKEYYRINVNVEPLKKLTISLLIWCLGFFIPYIFTNTYLDLARRIYTLFPLCYITAIAGTTIISEVSVMLCNLRIIANPICYLGKNSLYMLCIHILENELFTWEISEISLLNAICRVIIDIIIFVVFMFVHESLVFPTLNYCK